MKLTLLRHHTHYANLYPAHQSCELLIVCLLRTRACLREQTSSWQDDEMLKRGGGRGLPIIHTYSYPRCVICYRRSHQHSHTNNTHLPSLGSSKRACVRPLTASRSTCFLLLHSSSRSWRQREDLGGGGLMRWLGAGESCRRWIHNVESGEGRRSFIASTVGGSPSSLPARSLVPWSLSVLSCPSASSHSPAPF